MPLPASSRLISFFTFFLTVPKREASKAYENTYESFMKRFRTGAKTSNAWSPSEIWS